MGRLPPGPPYSGAAGLRRSIMDTFSRSLTTAFLAKDVPAEEVWGRCGVVINASDDRRGSMNVYES
jgi:hypothetical protein